REPFEPAGERDFRADGEPGLGGEVHPLALAPCRARVEPGDLEPAGADVGSRGGRVGEGDAEGVLDPGLEIEYADGVPLDGEIADRGIEADALADRGGTEFERGIGGARGLDEG